MRVLVYLEKAEVRGGIEVFAERHVAQLRAAGHEVDVVHSPPPFNAYDEIIVHKCSDVATLEAFPPEKTTYYVHDHEPIWWKAALARVFAQGRRKRAMARFKRIVVISAFMKGRLVANGLPAERIVVEPPTRQSTVDSRQPTCDVRHETGATVDLLFVGQLVRGKGVQLLLEAMARMRTPRTLDVVGTGNMEAKLKAQAERLGLAERVRWHGYQTNPQDWMRAAKCVVVPSFWQEPYGLVAAEAVALGRNVVAFDIGGLPEACQGKATLVPPGDVDALAHALDETGGRAGEMV